MIEFKLADYNLYNRQWQWTYDTDHKVSNNWNGKHSHHPLTPGMKVCGRNLNIMGIVTDVLPDVVTLEPYKSAADQTVRTYQTKVRVLWLTGKKKGKIEEKETQNLTNFSDYKKAVSDHLQEIEDIEAEGAMTGM
jgi:hypothetical protein